MENKVTDAVSGANQGNTQAVGNSGQNATQGPNALLMAYYYMMQSMQIGNVTAQIQEKQINSSNVAQSNLINQENSLNFKTISKTKIENFKESFSIYQSGVWRRVDMLDPNNLSLLIKQGLARNPTGLELLGGYQEVSQNALQSVLGANQEVQAVRGVMEDLIGGLTQGSAIVSTNLNSSVDSSQQTLQQGISMLQLLTSITGYVTGF